MDLRIIRLSALFFAVTLAAGAHLAWAAADGCSGTVKNHPLFANIYIIDCAGNCYDHPPCRPDPAETGGGVGPAGIATCVCGDGEPNLPMNGPCAMYMQWVTDEFQVKHFKVTCFANDCAAPMPNCQLLAIGIEVDSETGYLSGSGTVTCPCP